MEGHCSGGESQKRCKPKLTVGKLLVEVLFSVNPKKVESIAPPFPVELLTARVKVCAVVIAGEEESATCRVRLNCPD